MEVADAAWVDIEVAVEATYVPLRALRPWRALGEVLAGPRAKTAERAAAVARAGIALGRRGFSSEHDFRIMQGSKKVGI